MRLFLFDSLRFHLQKTAFGFDVSQTVIEISTFIQKIFRRLHHFYKIKFEIYFIIAKDKVMRLFLFDSLRFHLQKTAFGFALSQTVIEISLL
jgi:hypothetical protein